MLSWSDHKPLVTIYVLLFVSISQKLSHALARRREPSSTSTHRAHAWWIVVIRRRHHTANIYLQCLLLARAIFFFVSIPMLPRSKCRRQHFSITADALRGSFLSRPRTRMHVSRALPSNELHICLWYVLMMVYSTCIRSMCRSRTTTYSAKCMRLLSCDGLGRPQSLHRSSLQTPMFLRVANPYRETSFCACI